MGNLRNLLTNPMELGDTVHALVTAVLEDEANGPSGVTAVTGTAPVASSGGATPAISIPKATNSVDGYLAHADWATFNGKQDQISLTTGKMPIASGAHALGDGPIDVGVTTPNALTISNAGAGGTSITDSGGGGITLSDTGNGGIVVNSNNGLQGILQGVTGLNISAAGSFGIELNSDGGTTGKVAISNNGSGGTSITDSGGSGISIDARPGKISLGGILVPLLLYSAAGTALPDPTLTPGARAMVSDATANVYGTAYASGGSIIAPVYSDGSAWNMG